MSKFTGLQAAWKNLSTNMEKVKWIKEHQSELQELKVKVDNVKDAEELFNGNTNAVVEGFKARAKAAALAAKATALYAKQIEIEQQYIEAYNSKAKRAGDKYEGTSIDSDSPGSKKYSNSHYEANGGTIETHDSGVTWTYTVKGAEEYNRKLTEADKTLQRLESDYKDINAEIDQTTSRMADAAAEAKKYQQTTSSSSSSTSGGSDKKGKNDFEAGSLSDLENKLSELQKKYKGGLIKIDKAEYEKQVTELEKEIQKRRIELGLAPIIETGSLKDLEQKISDLQAKIAVTADPKTLNKLRSELQDLEAKKRVITFKLEAEDVYKFKRGLSDILDDQPKSLIVDVRYKSNAEKATEAAQILEDKFFSLRKYLDDNAKSFEAIKDKAADLRSESENDFYRTYEKATEHVKKLGKAYADAADKANDLNTKNFEMDKIKDGLSTMEDLGSGINNIYSSWKNLTESWSDMSTFEQVISVFTTTISTI